jgi:hypothetical protein
MGLIREWNLDDGNVPQVMMLEERLREHLNPKPSTLNPKPGEDA